MSKPKLKPLRSYKRGEVVDGYRVVTPGLARKDGPDERPSLVRVGSLAEKIHFPELQQ